ncbi:hypothetical protein Cgig2_023705 [Carnegiea gigantea]|uniref:Ribosomal protein n=1 Tax=Carnegiea gigantea TaxID=171969 RepID=A0A9Q1QJL2_9CARY|nr:hypothetical protein Cgig2_023705 [Carnegiea gigantea]
MKHLEFGYWASKREGHRPIRTVKRRGRVYILCTANPKHKQRQGISTFAHEAALIPTPANVSSKAEISNNPTLRSGLASLAPKVQQPPAVFGWRDAIASLLFKRSSGYLACGVKSTHVSKDDTQNGLQYQGQVVVDQPSLSDDFWGTSTDYLPGLSQRSISSLSMSNLSFYSDIGSASTNSRGEFVNHGKYLNIYSKTNPHMRHSHRGPSMSGLNVSASGNKPVFSGLELKLELNPIKLKELQSVKMPPMTAYLTQDSISDAPSLWE